MDFTWTDPESGEATHVLAEMTAQQIANATSFVQRLPYQLQQVSGGLLSASVTVRLASGTLTALTQIDNG